MWSSESGDPLPIYDISRVLSERTTVWPGDPIPRIERVTDVIDGDPVTVSALSLGTHSGTHVDAPRHMLSEGTPVDLLPLNALVGAARVIAVRDAVITAEVLAGAALPATCQRLLLKTSDLDAVSSGEVGLSEDGAQWLTSHGCLCVGIDTLSIDPPSSQTFPAHRLLLNHGVAIVEGLDLSDISPGEYRLVCLPLRLEGADGAPARAVLLTPSAE